MIFFFISFMNDPIAAFYFLSTLAMELIHVLSINLWQLVLPRFFVKFICVVPIKQPIFFWLLLFSLMLRLICCLCRL